MFSQPLYFAFHGKGRTVTTGIKRTTSSWHGNWQARTQCSLGATLCAHRSANKVKFPPTTTIQRMLHETLTAPDLTAFVYLFICIVPSPCSVHQRRRRQSSRLQGLGDAPQRGLPPPAAPAVDHHLAAGAHDIRQHLLHRHPGAPGRRLRHQPPQPPLADPDRHLDARPLPLLAAALPPLRPRRLPAAVVVAPRRGLGAVPGPRRRTRGTRSCPSDRGGLAAACSKNEELVRAKAEPNAGGRGRMGVASEYIGLSAGRLVAWSPG